MAEEIKKVEKEKIGKHKFFFELPLYASIKIKDLEDNFDGFFNGDVDAYNPNGFDITYAIEIQRMKKYYNFHNEWHLPHFDNFYAISLTCKRKYDILYFFIFANDEILIKVGQLPALADLQYAEIGKKYDKVLPKQDLHDLKKAIGLMAHGAGAGSLVYLRRIFENIIFNTYEKHKEALGIVEEEFRKKRMDKKVDFLKDYLPSQLVEMKAVYGILSKGVHELKEEDCLSFFPALKLSIILILDQKIEDEAKNKKDLDTKKAIVDIANKIK